MQNHMENVKRNGTYNWEGRGFTFLKDVIENIVGLLLPARLPPDI